MNTVAIDVGGTKLAVGLFEDERLALRVIRPTNRDGGREWMLTQIDEILSAWKRDFKIDFCGVGFGGPVDFASQQVYQSTHVGGWAGFALVDHLTAILHVPAIMDNDANAAALGEAEFGTGRGFRPLFYVTLSTGIGGGIILNDGSVYRGADSFAAEIGHMNIEPDGPSCLCGSNGCFERMCSGLWLERDYGKTPQELFEDPDFVALYVVRVARALKTAIMLRNPARIVIGGGIARAGEKLFWPLEAELKRQMPDWSKARLDVVPAALGGDSVLWGALALARQR